MFSIECLLSYVEFVQFKQYMRRRIYSKMKDADEESPSPGPNERRETDLDVVFPASVPHSEIVYNDDGDVSVKAKIYKFYLKYIQNHSEFEINILDSTRTKMGNMLKDYNAWMSTDYFDEIGLFHFYDGCIDEMRILLISSYKRFKEIHEEELELIFADQNNE